MGRISFPRYLIIIVSLVAGLWLIEQVFQLIYRIADILLIFGLAWLLKLLLEPLIRQLQRWRVPRGGAIAIAYILVIGGLVGGLIRLVPQFTTLANNLPRLAQQLALRTNDAAIWLQERGVEIDPNALTSQILGTGTQIASQIAQRAIALAQSFAGVLGRVALVITVSVYMSMTAGRMTSVLRPAIPPRWRDEYDTFVRDVNTTYSSYIRGYFYIVAIGTLMSGMLLFGFQIPSAALWLVGVFLLRLLPFIGGTLADLLLVITVFFNLPLPTALAALVLIVIGQTVLTNVLMPRVMSRELGINPLLVLFAVLLGGRIYGVAGILFSIPAAAIIATIIGKAVKRYLLPLYETGGWWTEQVTVLQQQDRRSGVDRRARDDEEREIRSAAYVPPSRPAESARIAEHPIQSKEASDAA